MTDKDERIEKAYLEILEFRYSISFGVGTRDALDKLYEAAFEAGKLYAHENPVPPER